MRSGQALQDWVDYQVASWMDHKVALKVAVFRLSENREQRTDKEGCGMGKKEGTCPSWTNVSKFFQLNTPQLKEKIPCIYIYTHLFINDIHVSLLSINTSSTKSKAKFIIYNNECSCLKTFFFVYYWLTYYHIKLYCPSFS